MRVRVEDPEPPQGLRWRGVALDEFTGKAWRKSPEARHSDPADERSGLFQVGSVEALHRLTSQTVFLEPLESAVLFGAPRVVAVQGDLSFVRVDGEGGLQSRRHDYERLIYKAISDTDEPPAQDLREDMRPYPALFERYLQLPDDLDPRLVYHAQSVLRNAQARNRYDAAKAIENDLQQNFGYSLEMKASGPDPLADFMFNVRVGHCEYFSTAMAVMLRTHGVAARVVNGFLPGEYNNASGAYTVRQSDAHSWVEVYFPSTRSWVTFDPTPSIGRVEPVRTGFTAQMHKYLEALELLWFQYVVGYDKQEQRSLASSLHKGIFDYGRFASNLLATIKSYLTTTTLAVAMAALGVALLVFTLIFGKRLWGFGWRRGAVVEGDEEGTSSSVDFYERLMGAMEQRGLSRDKHLTPLEFANTLGHGPAMMITRAYNRVRYGGQRLSATEKREIEKALLELESTDSLNK
jgi:transglutaminase-like putative cysteine protease